MIGKPWSDLENLLIRAVLAHGKAIAAWYAEKPLLGDAQAEAQAKIWDARVKNLAGKVTKEHRRQGLTDIQSLERFHELSEEARRQGGAPPS